MDRSQDFPKRAPRIDLRHAAVMIDSDGRETDVIILDVSSAGFRLEVQDMLRVGEVVTLRVEHSQEISGQIRWTLGNEAGGIFLKSAGGSHAGE